MRKIRKIKHIDYFYDIVHISAGNPWMVALFFYLLFLFAYKFLGLFLRAMMRI